MTVVDLQSKLIKGTIYRKPSAKTIRSVFWLVRIILYPGKIFNALMAIKRLAIWRLSIKHQIRKFKRTFEKANEFERMDSLAEISFLRESMEPIFEGIQHISQERKRYPLKGVIISISNSIYNELLTVEKTYHKKVYTDSPDSATPEFKEALKNVYVGFELEN